MSGTVAHLRKCVAEFTAESAGPQPSDVYAAQTWEMAGAHAFLMNGLLNVYEKADSIPVEKQELFTKYALQWCAALDHHHTWEENIYYPLYAAKMDTAAIITEHETFHAGVTALEDYLTSCLPIGAGWGYGKTVGANGGSSTYDGAKLKTLIDAFVEPMTAHLTQEIGYLAPEKIKASGMTVEEIKTIAAVNEKHMKSMPTTTFLTYVVIHTPKGCGFPPIPGPVRSFLVPWVFYQVNRSLWQFAPKV